MERLQNPGFISCFCLVPSPWKVFGNRRPNCFRLRFHVKGDVSFLPPWRFCQSHSGVKWERVVQWLKALVLFFIFCCQRENSNQFWLKQRLQHPFFVFPWSDSFEQLLPVLSKIPTHVHSSLHLTREYNENSNRAPPKRKKKSKFKFFFFFRKK